MELTISETQNFMRIFQVPVEFPEGYCFQGGKPTTFLLVDWFNPIEQDKFWSGKTVTLNAEEIETHHKMARDFIKGKTYYNPHYKYLALTDYNDAFFI